MNLVLDSSVTLARIFPDEWTPAILQLFKQIAGTGAWVPDLWKIEIANILSNGVRRGRLSLDRRNKVLHQLSLLPISFDGETDAHIWNDVLSLADRHKLTAYDAVYLELAIRRSLPLATLDDDLRQAAQIEEIPLLGL